MIQQKDRHLIDRGDKLFQQGQIQALDLWEQLIFVAMEQKGRVNEGNDIRQYGTIMQRQWDRVNPSVLQLTETIGKYRQEKLGAFVKPKATTTTQTVISMDFRRKQLEIEKYMDQGKQRDRNNINNATYVIVLKILINK